MGVEVTIKKLSPSELITEFSVQFYVGGVKTGSKCEFSVEDGIKELYMSACLYGPHEELTNLRPYQINQRNMEDKNE